MGLPNVYQISEEFLRLEAALIESGGEWSEEIAQWAADNAQLVRGKGDNISAIFRKFEMQRAAIATEKARLVALDKHMERSQDNLLKLVDVLLTALDEDQLEGETGGTWKRVGVGGNHRIEYPAMPTEAAWTLISERAIAEAIVMSEPPRAPLMPVIDGPAVRALFDAHDAKLDVIAVEDAGKDKKLLKQLREKNKELTLLLCTRRTKIETGDDAQPIRYAIDCTVFATLTPGEFPAEMRGAIILAKRPPRDKKIKLASAGEKKAAPEQLALS